ncbi:DUF2855 family protein [Variovorax sp. J22G21]|uniref:DUF2855 family protein n=1 Tax=Variovorax fucosicus TaxID=3053517 RepID=UPI002577AE6B|nr:MULTISPECIES: DUF2855 family protein [unclassified Variovorax]MDM0041668.1 DUF2855 family protein [Variovorax sp. J22R193]MDM0060724.1 DUF2855 family protein [Variovorax sp. J22G21]
MDNTFTLTRLQTRKNALGSTRVVAAADDGALQPGEVLMRIDRFALTTNNITYAAFGDAQMKYWSFFPTGDADWGHMPVWGFADVVASTVEGVEVGERFYGYFPIASHFRMQPVRVTPRGFYDGAPHRAELVSAYNQYMRCSTDAGYAAALEDYQMLVRPLFITSFMLADFLQDNAFFGARQIVVSSASSKTAYGTAFCLGRQAGMTLIAATSPGNRAYVEGLGCYDRVIGYDELMSLDASVPTLYVDFAGNDALRATIHHHFGDALVYDCYAGSAQNTAFLSQTGLPGPQPQLYFAPVQIKKRNADWGPQEVNRRFNEAQGRFIAELSRPGNRWMALAQHQGFAAAQGVIENLHAGRLDPQGAHIVVSG